MKPKVLILIGLIFVILSCNNDDEIPQTEINGEYVGIFERGGNNSNVELTFNNGNWSGESEIIKFPALCNGTYSNSGNVITFENACPWTAEFDWTLILGGEWNYSLNGNSLTLTKTNGDKYTLTKQ
ncbi:hypothetical protein E1J38_014870 [Seonamhaeicola sediminis]|uniref:META domain-containing protein n=1 Tax=Seonamhaeicola sediminis TaxID=2528206 RepID=A0A562Y6U7_9FLAO|nr:hypothetical protein [Seonamhaeicola sediminis]TWO29786.1 hypothetical protein E1J38_014870 [Seonamhaeicola sediminis]